MGRSVTPKYRMEIVGHTGNFHITPSAWYLQDGPPTTDSLDRYVTSFEASLRHGQPNAHLGIFSITACRIVRQADNEVMAEWNRKTARPNEPLFQVI